MANDVLRSLWVAPENLALLSVLLSADKTQDQSDQSYVRKDNGTSLEAHTTLSPGTTEPSWPAVRALIDGRTRRPGDADTTCEPK